MILVKLDMHVLAIVYMWYVMYFASTVPSLASSFFLLLLIKVNEEILWYYYTKNIMIHEKTTLKYLYLK